MEQKTSAFSRQALDSRAGSRIGKSLFSLKSNQNSNRSGAVTSYVKGNGSGVKGSEEVSKASYDEESSSKIQSESSGQSGPSTASTMKEGGVDA